MKAHRILILVLLFHMVLSASLKGQVSSVVIPSNTSTGSLEKNLLFHAHQRYQVTYQGPALHLSYLFDGSMLPTQTSVAPTMGNPIVVLIEGLPAYHSQNGAWVGWSTRVWRASKFRIEGYDTYNNANQWVDVANVTNNTETHYMVRLPFGSFTRLRFTFYESSGTNGLMQLSELFYIHPEAAQAYDGLMVKYNAAGNVGIGTTTPQERLSVNGNIRAKEIKVEMANWPDYVFREGYNLMPLAELESHIKQHGHLPGIPSAREAEADGIGLAEMNRKLLEKVEELTLHLIEKERREELMFKRLDEQDALLAKFKEQLKLD